MKRNLMILLAFVGLAVPFLCAAEDFNSTVGDLNGRSYSIKKKAIDQIKEIDDPRVLPTLRAMMDGDLFSKDSGVLVIKESLSDTFVEVISGEVVELSEDSLDKVKINNSIRRKLRTVMASVELTAKDKQLRLDSARNLIKSPDEDLREAILNAIDKESSPSIKETMQTALAMIDADSEDPVLRRAAVVMLGESLAQEAISRTERFLEKDSDGHYLEPDDSIVRLAEANLLKMKSAAKKMKIAQDVFFGLSLGSVLLLAAIGLAITFGVMGVINMAHGEMIMLGAYTTYFIQQLSSDPAWINISILVAIPAAFIVSGSTGVLIERTIIRFLYGRPLETLLATFGVSLFLQQLVRTYKSNNVPVEAPSWMSGSYVVNGALSLTYNRIYIIVFSLLVLGILVLLLKKTIVGLQMRAVTQNRAMANSMGIPSAKVDALTFGLGSGIAGIAGVALSQITNVGPNMGQGFIIDSFMVVVFGGVGNLMGTFVGAMSLGVVNKFLEPYSGAVLGKIITLIFIILFIQWRPRGLFALKGRFVED